MEKHPAISAAVELFQTGQLTAAIEALSRLIAATGENLNLYEHSRACLYLGAMHRHTGNYGPADQLFHELIQGEDVHPFWKAHAWIEKAIIRRRQGDLAESFSCLAAAHAFLPQDARPGSSPDQDVLLGHFHHTEGFTRYMAERFADALASYGLAKSFYGACGSRSIVSCCLNMAETLAMLGRMEESRAQLTLAFATMKEYGARHAYGLIHLFEVLAVRNLLIHRSPQKAIDILLNMSEEAVQSFEDFRGLYEFLSQLIVQAHSRRFDLDEIRHLRATYGNDPLIRKFLPHLLL